jgi:ATP-dependent DNA helicase RecG
MRPPELFPLFAPVTSLKGAGPKLAPVLEKLAGPLVRDLAFLAPTGLAHRPHRSLAEAQDGQTATFSVVIDAHEPPGRPGRPWKIRAHDDSGWVDLVYFSGHGGYLAERNPIGTRRIVSGKIETSGFSMGRQIVHPDYLVGEDRAAEVPEEEVIYPGSANLASRRVARLVREAVNRAPDLAEWQDAAWRARQAWPGWREAIQALHAPKVLDDLSPQAPARRRLAYDELLAHQLALARRKARRKRDPATRIPASDLADRGRAALPYALTGAQVRALSEIGGDLASGLRMVRLLQGDVGAGKTVVAMLAMLDAVAAGQQVVLLAPTEILARQHFETLGEALARLGIKAAILTGRDRGAPRARLLSDLAAGALQVLVGTHAVFQDDVIYRDLGLVVIDEQHRFGVAERGRMMAKGAAPHLLLMSATPIPRTLELTLFGDLDVSRLDEKPPGRQPVATRAAPLERLDEVVARLEAAVARGEQAFWICPLVAESELVDLAAAEDRFEALAARLGDQVGLVHGRMTPQAKDEVMERFVSGALRVLVSTTVVEVGVDVPAATIMVIEQAERFGLAQLHQLRGRVGRGTGRSSCVLLYDAPLSEIGARRLDILRRTEDGFEIAEKDLELRGGGDPVGLRQSGFPAYRFADPIAHRDLVLAAADDARLMLDHAPERLAKAAALEALFDWRDRLGAAEG